MTRDVILKPVHEGQDRMAFARLQRILYSGHEGFAAGLDFQLRDQLDPGKNPFFEHAEAELFLALRNGQPVGRISAQIDRLDAEQGRTGLGHFGFLAAADDFAVVEMLLRTAEAWLAKRGVKEITGPFNFSINGESGLLVDGFDERPVIMTPWDPPYLAAHVEKAGYRKAIDLLSYDFAVTGQPIAAARRFLSAPEVAGKVRVRKADKRRLHEETQLLRDIFNDAWSENWGFVEVTEAEMEAVATELKPILPEDAVAIVEVNGHPDAIALSAPNLHEVTADLDGRLLPFGWVRLGWRLFRGRYRSARVILAGVRKQHQHTAFGAGVALAALETLRENAFPRGIVAAELGWVLETNLATRRMLDLAGARVYKTHRIFEKADA